MAVVSVAAGARLGPYQLGERLGAGGMAEVYVARRAGPRGFHKKFAIKRILPQLARDPRFVAMFCDEARICAALSHPNIVQIVDFGEADGELFMALEFIDGVSVAKLLRAVAARGEHFPLGAALFIAQEVLRALSFAHEATDEDRRPLGIVHRDVSPGNILIGRVGDVKLTDFGIVRSSFIDRRTYPGELKGKLGYMSPEQVIGADVDARSDLFTVGIVMTEMLIARPLFPGRSEMEILTRIYDADLRVLERYGDHLPKDVLDLLKLAMARDPERRIQSARQFGEAVRGCARRADISLAEGELVPWLTTLGIVPSRSGLREATGSGVPIPLVAMRQAGTPGVGSGSVTAPVVPLVPRRATLDKISSVAELATRVPAPRPNDKQLPSRVEVPFCSGDAAQSAGTVQYHVRARNGALVGPLTAAQLLELVATGRLDLDAMVSESRSAFKPLRTLPIVMPFVGRPAFRFSDPLRLRAAWRRPLDRMRLPAVLYDLVLSAETGLLVARAPRRHKRVYFEAGAPRFVASSERRELLGARLIEAGAIDRASVEHALGVAVSRGRRLGETLVVLGALKPMTLLRALGEQLEARFSELFGWSEGELMFVRAETSGEEVPRSSSPSLALVTRAVREAYTSAEIADAIGPLCDARVVRRRARRLDVAALGLMPDECAALESASQAESIGRLLAELSGKKTAAPEATLRALYVGLSVGVIGAPGWTRG